MLGKKASKSVSGGEVFQKLTPRNGGVGGWQEVLLEGREERP